MRSVDDFLAECDDVIEDWQGSVDSATWAADGSHEHDTLGEYYGLDIGPRSGRNLDYAIFDETHEWAEWGAEIWRDFWEEQRRIMAQLFDRQVEITAWAMQADPSLTPVSDETRELLRQQTVDAMNPPRYYFRPACCA